MRVLAPALTFALLALPTAALADDLVLTFYYSPEDVEYSWTAHDVESGVVPTVTFESSEDEGFTVVTELEFTEEGLVQMAFALYDVTLKARKRGFPKVVTRSRLVSAPIIRVTPDDEAYIKQGNDAGYLTLGATYVTTDGAEEE
jgi:hypothetical protein